MNARRISGEADALDPLGDLVGPMAFSSVGETHEPRYATQLILGQLRR